MEKTREFDAGTLYPEMSRANTQIIQQFYNKEILPLNSDATYTKYMQALAKLCEAISDPRVPPFDLWDFETTDRYLSTADCKYEIATVLVKLTKEIIHSTGNTVALSQIKSGKYAGIYRIPFLTFTEMDTMIRRAYDQTHEHIDWSIMNEWSTTIVMCYLMWLGFTRQEMSKLRKEDYDLRTNVVIFEDKGRIKRVPVDEPGIETYLKKYINALGYYIYNDYHKEKFITYTEGHTLLKTVIRQEDFSLKYADQYARKFVEYFGFKADNVLDAGRLNRMYYLDVMKGVDIKTQNASIIAEALGIEAPKSITRNGELGSLILQYPSYKQQRTDARR